MLMKRKVNEILLIISIFFKISINFSNEIYLKIINKLKIWRFKSVKIIFFPTISLPQNEKRKNAKWVQRIAMKWKIKKDTRKKREEGKRFEKDKERSERGKLNDMTI